MSWLDVRTVIAEAIDVFAHLAATTAEYSRDADEIGSNVARIFDGSNNELPGVARDNSSSAATHAAEASVGYLQAARLCRDYLAAVDPDRAAGSVRGLGPPAVLGLMKGGYGPAGVPPARQAVTDVSRHRSHVFTEQGPQGLTDLAARDDGIIALRSRWMDAGGHARLRHGGGVTEQQLMDRAMYGKDPVNGSSTDWETGNPHTPVRHATAFAADSDLVFAEAHAWDSRAGRAGREAAEASGLLFLKVELRASEVFGGAFRNHVRGQTRVGSASNPQGTAATQFADDTKVMTIYTRTSANGPWVAYTCYPKA